MLKNFYDAARTNNVSTMKRIIEDNYFEELKDHIDMVMVEAASLGHLDVVKFLVEEIDENLIADIHYEDDRALVWASVHAKWDVVKYFIEKGVDASSNDCHIYKQMVINKFVSDDPLFIQLTKDMENKILNTFKTDPQADRFEDLSLEEVIKIGNNELTKNCINNTFIDESLLNLFIPLKDKEIIDLVLSKMDISDKNKAFFSSLGVNSYMAFKILQKYEDFFSQNKEYCTYDTNPSDDDDKYSFFIESSKLPRYYSPVVYDNNLQAFYSQLLTNALHVYWADNNTIEVMQSVLNNRKNFNIKDEHIVQFIVESCYKVGHQIDKSSREHTFNDFVELLIENNVSFASDINGYLIQLVVRNNIENAEELIKKMANNGSSLSNFIKRFNDESNWLTQLEEDELDEFDYNNDRTYDIYKKFDERNCFKLKEGEYDWLEKWNDSKILLDKLNNDLVIESVNEKTLEKVNKI